MATPGLSIDVRGDVAKAKRSLSRIRGAIPRITARAINELATYARSTTIRETARDLKLPQPVIRKTTRKGSTVDRFRLTRATPRYLTARITARSEGIQVTDVAGIQLKRKGGGVKAKGGRFYKGAFKAPAPGGKIRVWKRRGPERLPVFLPRIGTRQKMLDAFQRKVDSPAGRTVFRQRFDRLARFELAKAGLA